MNNINEKVDWRNVHIRNMTFGYDVTDLDERIKALRLLNDTGLEYAPGYRVSYTGVEPGVARLDKISWLGFPWRQW